MKHVFTSLLSLAMLAAAPLASQASGFGSEGVKLGVAAPKSVKASDASFSKGDNAINLGIGFGNRYSYGIGSNTSVSPALSVYFEHGIMDLGPFVLAIGGFGGYQSATWEGSGYKDTFTDIIINVRGALHYSLSEKVDAYGGLGVGYRHLGYSSTYSGPYAFDYSVSGSSGVAAFAGIRYYFASALGVFAEAGYDQTFLKAGLSLKF